MLKVILACIACIVLAACSTSTPNGPSALIPMIVIDTANVDFFMMGDDNQPGALKKQYVIVSQAGYDSLLATETTLCHSWDSLLNNSIHDTCILPPIDFTKRSLIGIKTMGTGCKQPLYPRTFGIDSSLVYDYDVHVVECGLCKPLFQKYVWLSVPRLETGVAVHMHYEEVDTCQ
jgi:hypothetical protein